ncbi:hypothetical protein PMAYCL1PPCAC_26939, partial [Pristionchus mayeri]
LGPICICPKGKTGPLCQFAHVVPSVDHQFVSEPSTTTATEEKAYVVQLPQVSSSILRLASDAPGLRLDESRSLLVWDSPRGTATAYNVTVVMSSPGGDTTFSWPLTVPVTYSAVVDRVVKEERKRRYLVEGRVVGTMSRKDVPVTVTFARSDGSEEEIEVKAEANGRFSLHWTPPGGSGEFNVIATHPGEKVDESNQIQGVSLRVKSTSIDYKQKVTEEELKKGIEYSLKSEGEGGKEEWTADVLYPSGNIAVESVKSTSHGVSVTYRLKRQFSGNLVVLFIRGEEKIIASHTVLPAPSNQISLTSAPSSITFNANENSRSELVRVALSSTGAPIFSPLSISFSSVPAPFELLYSEPPLEQYEQYSKKPLVLWLAPTDIKPISGTMRIHHKTDSIHQIPYSVVSAPSPFVLRICLRDAALSSQTPSSSTDAEMTMTRTTNNAVTVRQATVNGAAEEFEIVPGFYQLKIASKEYEERNEMVYVSSSNTSFCVDLSPIHSALLPSWSDERGMRVEMTGSMTDSALPLLLFSPSALTEGDHEVELTVKSRKGTIIALLPPTSENVEFFSSSSSSSTLLEDGDVVRISLRIDSSSIKEDCDGLLVSLPFVYEREDVSAVGDSKIIVMRKEEREGEPRICSYSSSSPVPLSLSTSILCDCASGARARCRQKYRGAAGCGEAWRAIPDDTVSTEILALFLSLVSSCSSMGIGMEEIHEATKCISQLESLCPINRKVAVIPLQGTGAYLASNLDASSSPPLGILLPVLRVLDLQSVGLASVYNEFFEKMESVFPSANYSSMSASDFSHFFESISDSSEIGQWISAKESEGITNGSTFLSRWNVSMSEWRSGKLRPFESTTAAAAADDVIDYAAAKQLVVAADRLKALARQQGAANPFSLLHDYVNRVLSSTGGGSSSIEECAVAHVFLSHSEIEEDGQFTVRVHVENQRKDTALDNVELTLDLVRDDLYQTPLQFRIGPFIYTGIRSLGGTYSLGPSQSFDATWTVVPVAERRLVREAHYQAIITSSFSSPGQSSTLMRLNSPRLTILPRPSLKLIYFLPRIKDQGDTAEAMVAIVNTGYRPLSGLRIESAQISVQNEKNIATPYSIDSVSLRDPSDRRDIDRDGLIGALPTIPSGRVLQMGVGVAMKDKGKLRGLSLTPSFDGAAIRLEDSRSFTVLTKPRNGDASGGLLVSPLSQSAPVFYFTPTDAKLQNVAGLKLIQSRWDSSSSAGKEFIRVQAAMQSNESPDFASTLWGRVELPKIPEKYKLLRVREVGSGVSPNGRGVGGETWIEQRDGKQFVNWIDGGAIPRNGNINYEFIFGDPNDFEQPIFAQDLYRIQLLPEFWPIPGTVVGEIRATSPIDKPLTYSLYSSNGDQTWAVNPNTGQIVLVTPLRRGEEICLTMVVKDSDGRQSVVPLTVNTGTAALPCPPITDFSRLTPLIWNPESSTLAPLTRSTIPASRPTTVSRVTVTPTPTSPDTQGTTVPTVTTAPPILTVSPGWSTPIVPVTTVTLPAVSRTAPTTSMNPAWSWMTTMPSVTSAAPLVTVPVVTVPIITLPVTLPTRTVPILPTGTTPEWVSSRTLPTDGWEPSGPSTITSSEPDSTLSPITSFTPQTSEGSTLTSSGPDWTPLTTSDSSESSTWTSGPDSTYTLLTSTSIFTTTDVPIVSHSPDSTLEPATTILIPWWTGSSTPFWTSTVFPTVITTNEYVEYTTEPATHPTHPTHIISSFPTLPTVPVTVPTTAQTHSVPPDSTLLTMEPHRTTPGAGTGSTGSGTTPGWLTTTDGETPFTLYTVPTSGEEQVSTMTISGGGTTTEWDSTTYDSTTKASESTLTPSEEDFSTRGLAVEACRLKGTAPIWGVICDLSKTVKTV